jgi:hypothetical protein
VLLGGPTGVLIGGPTGRLMGGLTGGRSSEHCGGVANTDWIVPVTATTPTAGTNSAAATHTALTDVRRRTSAPPSQRTPSCRSPQHYNWIGARCRGRWADHAAAMQRFLNAHAPSF